MAALRILLLTFTSRFVIDFLSIRKVIIFSAIATDDCHPVEVLVVIGKGSGIMSLPGDARANLTVSPQSCTI